MTVNVPALINAPRLFSDYNVIIVACKITQFPVKEVFHATVNYMSTAVILTRLKLRIKCRYWFTSTFSSIFTKSNWQYFALDDIALPNGGLQILPGGGNSFLQKELPFFKKIFLFSKGLNE